MEPVTTALAATIGTGNIIGVGTAIALGGPGRGALVLAFGCVRHCHKIQRGPDFRKIPGEKPGTAGCWEALCTPWSVDCI